MSRVRQVGGRKRRCSESLYRNLLHPRQASPKTDPKLSSHRCVYGRTDTKRVLRPHAEQGEQRGGGGNGRTSNLRTGDVGGAEVCRARLA